MRIPLTSLAAVAILLVLTPWLVAQQLLDRIVARVENDIILLSDVRELSRYQQFVDGKAESDKEILDRLIDQWIVRNEAKAALFPQPSEEDIDRSLRRLKRSFSSPEAFEERKKQSGLSDEDILHMLKSQLYLSNYLDTRFRPSIQIDEPAIEDYYKTRVVPRAESRGQTPPTIEAAHDFIQEALVQRAINVQADKWLKESRTRVRVDNLLGEDAK
jgi:Zn-dependent M16 (insulinase) family peptidase